MLLNNPVDHCRNQKEKFKNIYLEKYDKGKPNDLKSMGCSKSSYESL